jgi:uncharacterized protein (DUF608 family)
VIFLLLLALAVFALPMEGESAPAKLFPTDRPGREWVSFPAEGYPAPVCGVIFRVADPVTCGLALGGVDTGCIDLETSGLLGYCTIFNTHVPRRGPLNLPVLGLSTGGKTWVLCVNRPKQGEGWYQDGNSGKPVLPVLSTLKLDGVKTAEQIHYWGHYPVADLEFETDAPVSVGVRAWSPFLPGDVVRSMIPAIVFEVHLRNVTSSPQTGTVAFSFPGPDPKEAGTAAFRREALGHWLDGVAVSAPLASYALGAIGEGRARIGGELGADGAAWAGIARALPPAEPGAPGSSAAVDFLLPSESEKVVRFVLTWAAPTWNSVGYNWATKVVSGQGEADKSTLPRTFTHMYSKYYPDAAETARLLARDHQKLLDRTIAWQQAVYSEVTLPVWLRDSLINILYIITEDGYWGQKKAPVPAWVREEDGIWGMNECPRSCPQIECIPCSFYGSLPLTYFFPELQLSTIRAYKGYQFEDGMPPWVFGGCTAGSPYIDLAYPAKGYQWATNGISLAAVVDRFLMCRDDASRSLTREFYPMLKKCMTWTVNLRTTPAYTLGERIIAMPAPGTGESLGTPTEWFEAAKPGWAGMTAHVAGLRLAQLRITERLARTAGDGDFAKQCAAWIKAGAEAMENRLWDKRGYYLNYYDPYEGAKSEYVFGYQLDGQWITDFHGLPSAFPEDRVKTVLETIKRCNVANTKYGAVNYANPDGTPRAPADGKSWDYGQYSFFPVEALMLAMTYMYNGQQELGRTLAYKVWQNLICRQGYAWDAPNIMRGDTDSGERSYGQDYVQNMILWCLPAALVGKDLSEPARPGGLVDRIIRAARIK